MAVSVGPEMRPIIVTIEKPSGIEDIEALMKQHAITFTEKGETYQIVIRLAEWSAFIDMKIEQLTGELDQMKEDATSTDSISDLYDEIKKVRTWKFGIEMQSKGVSFASTRLGNTMKVAAKAFQIFDDGVLYREVHFTKGLEVNERERYSDQGTRTRFLKGLCSFTIWNLVDHCRDEYAELEEKAMIRTLQRQEVAKYLIAKQYKTSFEKEGIRLEITTPAP